MTEAELERSVRNLLAAHGLFGYHTHDSRRSPAGFPDWVIVGQAVMFRELKSASGVLTPQQTAVKYALLAAGADYAVWRPDDLLSGQIQRELAAVASPTARHRQNGERP